MADADRERTESAAGVELFQRYVTAGLEVCAATLRAAGSLVSAAVTNYQSVMDTALRSFPQRGPEGRAAPETEARNLPQRGTNATAAAEPAANQSEHRGSQTIDDRAVTASEDTGASGLTSGDRTASATTSASREQAEDPEAAQEVAASAASTENVSVPTTDEVEHADGAEDADATIGEAADPATTVHDAPPEAPAGTEVLPDEASPDPTGVGTGAPGGRATAPERAALDPSEPAALDRAVRVSSGVAADPAEDLAPTSPAAADEAIATVTVNGAVYAIRVGENAGTYRVTSPAGVPVGTVHRRHSASGRSVIWEARTMDDLPLGARAHASRTKAATALAEHHLTHPDEIEDQS